MLEMNDLADNGGIMSRAISEVHAYRTSAYIAGAISPSNVVSSGFNGYEVWNRGWGPPTQLSCVREELEERWSPQRAAINTGLPLPGSQCRCHCWTTPWITRGSGQSMEVHYLNDSDAAHSGLSSFMFFPFLLCGKCVVSNKQRQESQERRRCY